MSEPSNTSAARPRGLYCKHGHRLMVPDLSGEYESNPPLVFVEGDWPCDQPECSREQIEADFEREEAEYREAQWAEYRATISW